MSVVIFASLSRFLPCGVGTGSPRIPQSKFKYENDIHSFVCSLKKNLTQVRHNSKRESLYSGSARRSREPEPEAWGRLTKEMQAFLPPTRALDKSQSRLERMRAPPQWRVSACGTWNRIAAIFSFFINISVGHSSHMSDEATLTTRFSSDGWRVLWSRLIGGELYHGISRQYFLMSRQAEPLRKTTFKTLKND